MNTHFCGCQRISTFGSVLSLVPVHRGSSPVSSLVVCEVVAPVVSPVVAPVAVAPVVGASVVVPAVVVPWPVVDVVVVVAPVSVVPALVSSGVGVQAASSVRRSAREEAMRQDSK